MRSSLLRGVAALALAGSSVAVAQPRTAATPAPAASRWETRVQIVRWHVGPADEPPPAPREGPLRSLGTPSWMGPEDVPADLRARRFSAITAVEIMIDPAGRASGCRIVRASGEPRLDRLACDRIAVDSSHEPFYAGPGRPIASRWTIAIGWETIERGGESAYLPPVPAPPAPPPPPPGAAQTAPTPRWPRFDWTGHLRPTALPSIQDMFPTNARRRAGTVGIELAQSPELGITGCTVAASSGDRALDEAACAAARRIELNYREPCSYCGSAPMPLKIVWNRRGGSHIRLPLLPTYARNDPPLPRDPADTRTATRLAQQASNRLTVTAQDLQGIDLSARYARFVVMDVVARPDGRALRCTMARTTGHPAIDERLCRIVRERLRFEPRRDLFGDPVPAAPHTVWITISDP